MSTLHRSGAEVWDHIAEMFQQTHAWEGVFMQDLERKVTVVGAASSDSKFKTLLMKRDSSWQWAFTTNLLQDGEVCLVFSIGKGE